MTKIKTPTDETLKAAAEILRAGGLVGMPTETVYGLAGSALDGQAIAKIYDAKGRPSFNPLIVHVASRAQAETLGVFNAPARALAQAFWPGPLTMILPRAKDCPVSELATAGLDTIALRLPAHKTARALIEETGLPIVAPSANRSGRISATTPAHVAEELGGAVDMILAAGACDIGLESTVIDLSTSAPAILRPGAITADDLENIIQSPVPYHSEADQNKPRAPGQLLKHYAPSIPVRLNAIDLHPEEALLAFGSEKFMGIQGGGAATNLPDTQKRNLSERGDLYEAAANLFAMMKELDRPEHRAIAVMNIPNHGIGLAINDRLQRATN